MKKQLLKLLPILTISAIIGTSIPALANKDVDEVVATTGLSGSYLAARVATADNDNEAAVSFLKKSLALDPENNRIRRNLFHAYLANGEIDAAVLLSHKIANEKSNGNIIAMVEGVSQIKGRSWVTAANTFSDIKGSDLDGLIAGILGAWAKFGDGKSEEALNQIDAISGADWMDELKQLHRGLMYSALGKDEAAVEVLQKAVNNRAAASFLTETYIDAVDALARAQQRIGKLEEARATVKSGLDIFPNRPSLHAMNNALDTNKPAGLLVANPAEGAAEFYYNLGNAIGREGGTPFALIYLQLAKYLFPQSGPILISLASVYEKQKNPEHANTYYAQIKDTSPLKRRARLETAINLNTLKKVDGAVELLQGLVKEDESDLIPYMTLGRLFNQHKKYQQAADIFDKAIALIKSPERKHWDYFYRRAISYERLGNWDKAEASFKKALELDPNRATVLNYLGYSWVDKGIHLDEGLDMIRKAVKLRPSAGFIVDSLGWAYYKLGRYPQAMAELEKAIELLPQDPVVNDHLGDVYWQTGRKLEAKFQWQHALDAKPSDKEAAKIRKKLVSGIEEKAASPVAKSD